MTLGPTRRIPVIAAAVLLCAVVGLLLAVAPSAHATHGGAHALTMNPVEPTVGQEVTFTFNPAQECPNNTPREPTVFTVDGTDQPPQASNVFKTTFSTGGSHTVAARSSCPGGVSPVNDTLTFEVKRALAGTISVSPDPPVRNQTATLSATQTGGTPGYLYAWDTDDDGSFDDAGAPSASNQTLNVVFPTTGPRVVRVQITDSATPANEIVVGRTITVADPPPPPPPGTQPPPPPAPPPCVKRLAFELSEFTTDGCFTRQATSPSERWTTTASVRLNGIRFPSFGQTFTITLPTSADPGGRFTARDSTIQLESFKVFSGDIDWRLPTGKQGDEPRLLKEISVALGSKIFGLNVRGSIGILLAIGDDGRHYATFPMQIELPVGFETGPTSGFSRATGGASLRVDETGVKFDGLKLSATNVWLGKLKVIETCFSFVPSGGRTLAECDTPRFDGAPTPENAPYISCKSDVNTDRWDGNAVIQLPKGNTQLAAFGGLANGRVSKLGAFVNGLGRKARVGPEVFLDKIAFGLCLSPPPFKIRGDVGVSILPPPVGVPGAPVVGILGTVTYTDSDGPSGWTLEAGGSVAVLGKQVGEGSVTLRAYNGIDFQFRTNFNVQGIVSLDGQVNGWVDPPRDLFSVSGSVMACVGGGLCATGSGVISTLGVAGCITIESTTGSPDLLISTNPFRVRFDTRRLFLRAGFGYRWQSGAIDLFANSCNFSAYQPVRQFGGATAAQAQLQQRIARGTDAVSWRIRGSDGPPKVVIRGPRGTTITSPTDGISAQRKGEWMLVENERDGTTNVLLIGPPAGAWTVKGVPGERSRPTRLDRAKVEAPSTVAAKVRRIGDRRAVKLAYAIPKGATLRLVERAKGISRALTGSIPGQRCPGTRRMRPGSDQAILCATVRFRPSGGPGGRRRIQAIVTRNGIPLMQKDVASFRAAKPALPARLGKLHAHRANGFLVVAFPRSRGASRYVLSAKLSDGRVLGFDLARRCNELQLPNVPGDVAATVTIAGMRSDLVTGPKRSISIRSGVRSAGPKSKVPRSRWPDRSRWPARVPCR